MLPIKDVAAAIGIKEDDLELYGKYKAKISDKNADDLHAQGGDRRRSGDKMSNNHDADNDAGMDVNFDISAGRLGGRSTFSFG